MTFEFNKRRYRIGFKHTVPNAGLPKGVKGLKPGDKGYIGTTEATMSAFNAEDGSWEPVGHMNCGVRMGVCVCVHDRYTKEAGRMLALDRLLLADDWAMMRARDNEALALANEVRTAIINNAAYTEPFSREFRDLAWAAYYAR